MSKQSHRRRVVRQTRRTHIRALTFGVIVILVLGAAGYLLKSGFASDLPAPSDGVI